LWVIFLLMLEITGFKPTFFSQYFPTLFFGLEQFLINVG
jgi:hypothetical protein